MKTQAKAQCSTALFQCSVESSHVAKEPQCLSSTLAIQLLRSDAQEHCMAQRHHQGMLACYNNTTGGLYLR